MKAIVQDECGSTDVLALRDIDKPVVKDDDVLVHVHAASVHIGDWHVMAGKPYMLRIVGFGLRAPKVRVRGLDVAGTVESVGKNVTRFQAGDDEFGDMRFLGIVSTASEPDALAFQDWHPVDAATWEVLERVKSRADQR